jgi:cardiolipin synthase
MVRRLRRLVLRGILAYLAAQLLVIGVLSAIDGLRKRYRSQGVVPRVPLPPVGIGDSEVQLYTYGEDLYAAMLHAIAQAREQILFETFIWKDDPVGRRFKQELHHAAARGVAVYVIFDSFANLVVPRRFKRFAPALHVLEYPLLAWPWHPLHLRSYARDHRKILVVDGETAFVGGYNIGSPYATRWRDTHARITGPSAGELENVFVDFWNSHRRGRLPEIPNTGTRTWERRIAIHRNDPPMLMFPIRATYLEAIDRAQRHIYLTHAYFIPDRVILRGLLTAAARGVDVRILLPQTSNHVVADWLARGYYMECLASGIRLLRYQNMMVHAKTATIDGVWSTVGTANMDRLSMIGNFEVNVEVYDEALARQMEHIFVADAAHTRELTLEEWRHRPLPEKLAEAILLPLRPLL